MKKGGLIAAVLVSVVGGFEGFRSAAYRDSVGVPTICYGETKGVRMGTVKTRAECDAMFVKRLDEFADGVERCVPSAKTMAEKRYAAHVSLAYNIGIGGYCKSSVARLQNAGHADSACHAFMKWNRAGGMVLPGLTKRRAAERKLCLEG